MTTPLLTLHTDTVRSEWIDYNGHMSEAYYVLAFGFVTDAFYDYIGVDARYRESSGCSFYTAEAHVSYLRELKEATPLRFTTQLLGYDTKRMHLFHQMFQASEEYLAATTELMLLHVDQGQGRTAPLPRSVLNQLELVYTQQVNCPLPNQVGRAISLRRKRG